MPAFDIVSPTDSKRSGWLASFCLQSGPSLHLPPPGRKTRTLLIGCPAGARRIQKAYGLPSPQRVPVVALSSVTWVATPGFGTSTPARGPQSSESGAVDPCATGTRQCDCAEARLAKRVGSI